MARMNTAKKAAAIGALVEGSSIRSTERMTGIHRDTICKLVVETGRKAEALMADQIRHVRPQRLQMDEIWCFVGKKKANLRPDDDVSRLGDQWCWVAIDPDSKLVPHHRVGKRDEREAVAFTSELSRRVEGRIQISTDKLAAYRWAISQAWGRDVDYGRIVKRYAGEPLDSGRYSPPQVVKAEREIVWGAPDVSRISTSHVERQNLTMRMGIRRFTRLTNGFSKKVENLRAAVALHFAYYNFCRRHLSIKTTPALAAGVADHRWSLEELVEAPY